MRHVVIEKGTVVNVVLASPEVAEERGWLQSDEAEIGWSWDGQVFTAPPVPPAPPAPPRLDRTITARDKLTRVTDPALREVLDEILKLL